MSRGTRVFQSSSRLTFVYRTSHLLWWAVPGPSTSDPVFNWTRRPNSPPLKSHNPRSATRLGLTQIVFRLFPVRSPLLRESHFVFFFLRILRCFNSPGIAAQTLRSGLPPYDRRRVAPFGNLRVKACLRLSEAYRSLPRPSSPSRAKSSTISPWSLDHRKYFSSAHPSSIPLRMDSGHCMRCDLNLYNCQRAKN